MQPQPSRSSSTRRSRWRRRRAEVLRFGELYSRVTDKRVFAVLHVYVRGGVPGHLVVMFDHQDALDFVGMFLKRVGGDLQLYDAVVETTLKELANIVASSYLSAVVQLTSTKHIYRRFR